MKYSEWNTFVPKYIYFLFRPQVIQWSNSFLLPLDTIFLYIYSFSIPIRSGDDCSSFDIKCIIKEGVKLVICVKKWTDLWIFCHYYHYYDDLLFIVSFRFLYCNLFPKSRQPSFCYFCWDVTYWQEKCHKMNLNSMYSSHKFEFFRVWMTLLTNFCSSITRSRS